ncbi:hypothetical protein MGG_08277 [Pyricularia oryzae 70-15]|uniref:Uncharacterized protein n=1 Tax=Pyricularia oryzae (strain 70-15 / ATCC MYA-4617 / FGSC 8958) TaxID=242507 RepID=G4MXA3_PYRO7|nr:uncharacterized protein MGG_08277 [Pyricularia oryzae 70-15]EHA56001.1 hypothetical protein MGG_08277 [Pyricularia oryzae 70-15]
MCQYHTFIIFPIGARSCGHMLNLSHVPMEERLKYLSRPALRSVECSAPTAAAGAGEIAEHDVDLHDDRVDGHDGAEVDPAGRRRRLSGLRAEREGAGRGGCRVGRHDGGSGAGRGDADPGLGAQGPDGDSGRVRGGGWWVEVGSDQEREGPGLDQVAEDLGGEVAREPERDEGQGGSCGRG